MDKGVSPKTGTVSHCFFENSLMGAFTLHRYFADEGSQGWRVPGGCGSGTVGAMGTKEKLLLLKLGGHVTWGQKFACPQCTSVVSLLLWPLVTRDPAVNRSLWKYPTLHLPKKLGDGLQRRWNAHLHPHRLQGPAPSSQHRNHSRTHPAPKGS